jgi:hypothetical protein
VQGPPGESLQPEAIGALVVFGYPEAHEHDAEQAIRAGLELCAAVRTLRPDADAPL